MISKEEFKIRYDSAISPLKNLLEAVKKQNDLLFAYQSTNLLALTVSQAVKKYGFSAFANSDQLTEIEGEDKEATNVALTILEVEYSNSFPFLYSQACINLYTSLEAAVKDLVIGFFKYDSIVKNVKAFESIKISYYEYNKLDEVERLDFLFDHYERSVSAGLKYGIERFESLLKPIKLSGEIEKKTADAIFELGQVRNNLLHKNGFADRHLRDSCPWLNLKLSDKLIIDDDRYKIYRDAIMSYLSTLTDRLKVIKFYEL